MATWTSLYVETDDPASVVDALRDLAPGLEVSTGPFPGDIGKHRPWKVETPSYLAVGNPSPGWTTIVHNSFDGLENWGETLSARLNTRVIITMAQSVSSAYYFALYESGTLRRRIEECHSDDSEPVHEGAPLPFEGPEPGLLTDHGYLFDFDALEAYCRHFDLELQPSYEHREWTLLRSPELARIRKDREQALRGKKPWWKFW